MYFIPVEPAGRGAIRIAYGVKDIRRDEYSLPDTGMQYASPHFHFELALDDHQQFVHLMDEVSPDLHRRIGP